MSQSPRQHEIIHELRQQIIRGDYQPGKRLPTRSALERHFAASSVTVQRALDRLAEDGFVDARGRQGTFVPARPPHLYHYGLVILARRGDEDWNHFWNVLATVGGGLFENDERWLTVYEGVKARDERHYPQLLHDIEARRSAGLIFATNPFDLVNTPVLDLPGIPRVMIGPEGGAIASRVELDSEPFFERALDHLAAQGRRRVALLTVPGIPPQDLERFRAAVAARGMQTRRHWQQAMVISSPVWAARLTELMLLKPADGVVPDALIITDDNLVEYAVDGLAAAGVRVPEDMDVVAHANFPHPTTSALPITRLGYDVRTVLSTCVRDLERQRREGLRSTLSSVSPVFDSELTWPARDGRSAGTEVIR